jgi:hypothetical protein
VGEVLLLESQGGVLLVVMDQLDAVVLHELDRVRHLVLELAPVVEVREVLPTLSARSLKSVLSRSSRRKGLVQREPPGHVPLFPASINATRPALPAFSAASRKLNVAVEPAKSLPMTTIS